MCGGKLCTLELYMWMSEMIIIINIHCNCTLVVKLLKPSHSGTKLDWNTFRRGGAWPTGIYYLILLY